MAFVPSTFVAPASWRRAASAPASAPAPARGVAPAVQVKPTVRVRRVLPVAVAYRLRASSLSKVLPLFPHGEQLRLVDTKRTISEIMDSVGVSIAAALFTALLKLPLLPYVMLTWPLLAPFARIMVRNARFRLSLRNNPARIVTGRAWVDYHTDTVLLDDGTLLLRAPASPTPRSGSSDPQELEQGQAQEKGNQVKEEHGCALVVGLRVLAIIALDSTLSKHSVFSASPMVDTTALRRIYSHVARASASSSSSSVSTVQPQPQPQ